MTHSLTYKGRTVRITLSQEPAGPGWTGQWKVVTHGAPETVLHIENIGEGAQLLRDHALVEATLLAQAWIDGHGATPVKREVNPRKTPGVVAVS